MLNQVVKLEIKVLLKNENFVFNVYDTTKIFGNFYIHTGEVIEGECSIGHQVTGEINNKKRNLTSNNHSSTHLLHAALRIFLGKHVTQKGSLVNDKKLRFDFSHNSPLTSKNIEDVNILINQIINQKDQIKLQLLDYKVAIKNGAMALFGEKYTSEVRVVSMGIKENKVFSLELCGGTHVKNTGDIKKFSNNKSIISCLRY